VDRLDKEEREEMRGPEKPHPFKERLFKELNFDISSGK